MTAVVVVQVKVKKMNVDNGSRRQSFYSLVWGMPLEREMFGVSHTYAIEMEGVCALVFLRKQNGNGNISAQIHLHPSVFCAVICVYFSARSVRWMK